jgi:hypothetical protein
VNKTLGGFLAPLATTSEAEEAAFGAYVDRHFPALRDHEPTHEQRLADMLSEPEPATPQQTAPTVPVIAHGPRQPADGDAEFELYMQTHFPQTRR